MGEVRGVELPCCSLSKGVARSAIVVRCGWGLISYSWWCCGLSYRNCGTISCGALDWIYTRGRKCLCWADGSALESGVLFAGCRFLNTCTALLEAILVLCHCRLKPQ